MNISLGPWLFITQRCLITSSKAERELDPLSFKLLNYFVVNDTRIISRQELVEQVWQQSFVDDNAINRAISELRKQLSHPELKSGIIKTHYRKGYSLTVAVIHDVEDEKTAPDTSLKNGCDEQVIQNKESKDVAITSQIAEPTFTSNSPQSAVSSSIETVDIPLLPSSDNRLLWVIGALVILVILLVVYVFGINNDNGKVTIDKSAIHVENSELSKNYSFSVTSATWNTGGESNPLVSSDKVFFAYSNIHQGEVKTYVKRLSDQAQIVLEVPDYSIGGLSWQLGQSKLLTLQVNLTRKECYYVLFDIAQFPDIKAPQRLTTCDVVKNGYAQLDKEGEKLYFTQIDEGFSGAAIYQYDIKKQRAKVLVAPSDNPYGVTQVRLSPDGRYLAYLWAQIKAPMKVYLMDLTTRENSLLYEMETEHFNFSLNWFSGSKHLLVNELGELLKINIINQSIERIALPDGLIPFYAALEFDNQLLFSQSDTQQYQLIKGEQVFSGKEAIYGSPHESESSDFYPEASKAKDDLFYFVSRRTGNHQIWRSFHGELTQITWLEDDFLLGELHLSIDGERLLFMRDSKLHLLDFKSNRVRVIDELKHVDIVDVAWGDKPHLFYVMSVDDDSKQLLRVDLMTRELDKLDIYNAEQLYDDGLGTVYYLSNKALINVLSGQRISLDIPDSGLVFGDVNQRYFYSTDALSRVYRVSLSSGVVERAKVPFRQRNFSVADDDTIIFTKRQFKNTSIKRVSWQE